MENLQQSCPNCGKILKIPVKYIGKRVKCSGCQELFSVALEAEKAKEDVKQKASVKKCPFCAELIQEEAILCKHCGKSTEKAGPEETVFTTHPAMLANNPIAFVLCLFLIIAYGVGILILLFWWLSCRASTLIITTKRTTVRKGLIAKHTNEVLHAHVLNIQIKQGIFQRMFGVGTIALSSAGQSEMEIVFSGLKNPQHVRDLIEQHRGE